jgi:hypothetical protein
MLGDAEIAAISLVLLRLLETSDTGQVHGV